MYNTAQLHVDDRNRTHSHLSCMKFGVCRGRGRGRATCVYSGRAVVAVAGVVWPCMTDSVAGVTHAGWLLTWKQGYPGHFCVCVCEFGC